jgi:hypothetical protein
MLELAIEVLLLEVRHNECYKEVVSVLDLVAQDSVLYIIPFPDIELGGGVVSALIDAIAQVD